MTAHFTLASDLQRAHQDVFCELASIREPNVVKALNTDFCVR